MSYVPTDWKNGDVVTSTKLNKLEHGVANVGGLPAVTSDDNGDVLTVVEGAWAKVALPVNALIIDKNGNTFPSYKDITDAIKQGKNVIGIDVFESDGNVYSLSVYYISSAMGDDGYSVTFYTLEQATFALVADTATENMHLFTE